MIPDDEEIDPVIDFTWFYFIGKAKLNLSFHETGRLTLKIFNKLYQHYKDDFDLETRLKNQNVTYKEAYAKAQKAEEWF